MLISSVCCRGSIVRAGASFKVRPTCVKILPGPTRPWYNARIMLTCFERGGKEKLRIFKMTTNDDVSSHPYRELMAEAQHEREVINSPEGQDLENTPCAAVWAYS